MFPFPSSLPTVPSPVKNIAVFCRHFEISFCVRVAISTILVVCVIVQTTTKTTMVLCQVYTYQTMRKRLEWAFYGGFNGRRFRKPWCTVVPAVL